MGADRRAVVRWAGGADRHAAPGNRRDATLAGRAAVSACAEFLRPVAGPGSAAARDLSGLGNARAGGWRGRRDLVRAAGGGGAAGALGAVRNARRCPRGGRVVLRAEMRRAGAGAAGIGTYRRPRLAQPRGVGGGRRGLPGALYFCGAVPAGGSGRVAGRLGEAGLVQGGFAWRRRRGVGGFAGTRAGRGPGAARPDGGRRTPGRVACPGAMGDAGAVAADRGADGSPISAGSFPKWRW